MPLLIPTAWISWRTYPSSAEQRTWILNQRTREFLLLESVSSKLWHELAELQTTTQELPERLNLDPEEIDVFCKELVEAGLLLEAGFEENPASLSSTSTSLDQAASNLTDYTTDNTDSSDDLEREMMAWVEQEGFIYAAHWEMTYRCNELCVHCYNPGAAHSPEEKPQRETDELTTAEAKALLFELAALGVFRLTLSGGEPTLRKDFIELLKDARRLGFQVVIYTNGLKMSDRLLDTIANLHPWSIEFSVYSSTPAQHDAITRVPGSYQRTMRSLAYFRSRGIHTVFKSSLTNSTTDSWHETLDLAKKSADSFILNTIISPGVTGKIAPLHVAAEFGQLVILAATPGSPLFVGGKTENWGRSKLPARNKKPCGAGHGSIAINPEGVIYPCIAFPLPIGSFRDRGLRTLKRKPPLPQTSYTIPDFSNKDPDVLLDEWRSIRMNSMTDCGKHERCHYCGDLCPGDAYVQNGNPLSAAENHCRQAYARMTAGKSLEAGQSLEDLRKKFGVSTEYDRGKHARSIITVRPTI